ncbi:MAG: PfkB family carbohydrate kinase [Pseudobdellovibrionaceae bacterium]
MSEILVVGSLAYDSLKTPSGKKDRALGGSANYFSVAASMMAKVRVVGVVGEDYSQSDMEVLTKRNVDISGMTKVPGKTFHWEGSYGEDLNEATTLKTELNVFEQFNPQLPAHYTDSKYVFLANIHPALQMQVLNQVKSPIFIGCDTMNFWIQGARKDLDKVLGKINVVLINEGEAKMLTGKKNAVSAAQEITKMGPQYVVIKRGEYGFVMYSKENGYFSLPAFPTPEVVDPTGAGDTFAGGFFGYLASLSRPPQAHDLRQACVRGAIMASFTIQDFGLGALSKVTMGDIESKMSDYLKIIALA